jgi:hypothetical protein
MQSRRRLICVSSRRGGVPNAAAALGCRRWGPGAGGIKVGRVGRVGLGRGACGHAASGRGPQRGRRVGVQTVGPRRQWNKSAVPYHEESSFREHFARANIFGRIDWAPAIEYLGLGHVSV